MSNYIVKDKKKKMMFPSKKLWRNLVSTFHSKFNSLTISQSRSQSRKTTCRLTGAISCPQHHHHHHGQTINNHHHHHHYYYYHPDQPSGNGQKQPDAEKCLFIDNKASTKPCSEVAPTNTTTTTNMGQHIRTITPDMEFFDANDDEEDDEMESESGAIVSAGCGDYGYITFSKAQLLEVDAKAEEFINQRKQAWRLEKQKSEEEYWLMLARGT